MQKAAKYYNENLSPEERSELILSDLADEAFALHFWQDSYAAGLGGVIPWQAGIETGIGRFQFILGREIGLTLYGTGDQSDLVLVAEQGANQDETTLITLKSTQLDFPIVEYRPFRTFSLDQSSSLVIQLNFGVDIPHSESVFAPEGASVPDLKSVWYVGMRIAFDWRS